SCQMCHKDSVTMLAPGQSVFSTMTPRAILASLDNGKMRQQAAKLSPQERKAVAQWLTNAEIKEIDFPKEAYTSFTVSTTKSSLFDHSGWGGDKEGTGYRKAEQAGITVNSIQSLQLKW